MALQTHTDINFKLAVSNHSSQCTVHHSDVPHSICLTLHVQWLVQAITMQTDLHELQMLVHNKWNAILSQLLYSCTLIIDSCFNTSPGILQAILQPGNKHLTLFFEKSRERRAKYIEFVVSVHRVFLLLIGRVPLWSNSTQQDTWNPFGWSSTPKPLAGKKTYEHEAQEVVLLRPAWRAVYHFASKKQCETRNYTAYSNNSYLVSHQPIYIYIYIYTVFFDI